MKDGSVADLRRSASRGGLTLVEVLFSIAVMSTMLLAALGSIGAAARTQRLQQEGVQGLALARQLMSEIVQTRYKDLVNPVFGVEAGETRSTYDDVDDYQGLNEPSATYASGAAVAGGSGWARKVEVAWVAASDPTQLSASDKGLKRITVTVTSPTGRSTQLVSIRSSDDGYENTPGSQVTYTSHVGVSIQVGGVASTRCSQGVALKNLVP